uniref:Uncharacterized protein n=1 Tax=Anguilla anguilla TaxID=7936 RepID=A0A0E9T731_ANGAN
MSYYYSIIRIMLKLYTPGLPNYVPGDLPSCKFSLQPQQNTARSTSTDLVELVIKRISCAKLGLK